MAQLDRLELSANQIAGPSIFIWAEAAALPYCREDPLPVIPG